MRILAIDGGGIRGVIPAYLLMKLEEQVQRPLRELVDVVAGTSTGAIIAAAVATGKEMKDVYQLYEEQGKRIFEKQSPFVLWEPFYKNKSLKTQLKKEFGNIALKDISFPLLIPTVNITKGKIHVFRSGYHAHREDDKQIKLWDAVLSSCSAPIYFPPNNVQNNYLAADGGLWANNPSLLCLTEGVHYFGKTMDQIKILSIGTGRQKIHFKLKDKKRGWGLREWISFHFSPFTIKPTLLDLALHLSSESISYHCQLLCKENFFRVNKELGEEIPIDDFNYVDKLVTIANDMYRCHSDEIVRFLNLK